MFGPPPRTDLRARGDRALDEAVDPLEVGPADQRADVDRLVARVALRRPRRRARGTAPRNSSYRPSWTRIRTAAEADLAGVVELLHGEVDGEVEVGVVEDQQRRLAAELEADRRHVAGGRLGDLHRRSGPSR